MDSSLTFLIVPAVMGVIGFVIGNIRGRALFGLVLGLLLGPIGWLLVLCFSNVGVKCGACCKAIDENARICPYCRTVRNEIRPPAPPPQMIVRTEPSLRRTIAPSNPPPLPS